MRFRGKNSLPLTPKTVHLLHLPRTIGKRIVDDNKIFPLFYGQIINALRLVLRTPSRSIAPLNRSSRREEALTAVPKNEPPYVGCYAVQGQPPFASRMHWDHEPTPNPSQEGNC